MISEINYKSEYSRDAGDWLEIHNYGSSAVHIENLDCYRCYCTHSSLYDSLRYIHSPANGYLVFYNHSHQIQRRACRRHQHFGSSTFCIKQDRRKIMSASAAAGTTVTSVYYMDTLAWPRAAKYMHHTKSMIVLEMLLLKRWCTLVWLLIGSSRRLIEFVSIRLFFQRSTIIRILYKMQGEIELFNTTSSSINLTGCAPRQSDRYHHQYLVFPIRYVHSLPPMDVS